MRTLSLLTIAVMVCGAQTQPAATGQVPPGRGRGGPGAPSPSVPYPGTAAAQEATEKLIAMVKAIAPDPSKKPPKKSAKRLEEESAVEQALRTTLNPLPAATANNPNPPTPVDRVKAGTAVAGEHGEFVWAVESATQPLLHVTNVKTTLAPMKPWQLGALWVYQGQLKTGSAYKFHWMIDGKPFGGANDIPAFTEDSYAKPGVPQGKLVGPIELTSKVYPGMKSNIWYYVPAQYDGSAAIPVQIWGDGQFYIGTRPTAYRLLDTFDNLTAQKKIPVMVNVFTQAGTGQGMRSIEYDSVDDRYSAYILDEVLAEVGKNVKLRQDGYSRAMVGESSGGICSFNAAYRKPDQFSRVLSWIGSFAALQTSAAEPTGGFVYPVRVRMEPKKNIRVWLQDGAEDQENGRAGSWILQNIQLANSLKLKGYDYRFSLGPGTHSQRQGSAELPESLTWLWRDYDPAKTSQDFVQEASEQAKPLWRVVTMNRE